MRDDRAWLLDILEAVARLERYAGVDREVFGRDELIQTWMIHHLQIIGEAAAQLSADLRSSHPEVPWRVIAAMRNILVHAYFRVDLDEVWSVVHGDLPALKAHVRSILGLT